MADFHQTGIVSTLHRLRKRPIAELESEILAFTETSPIALRASA